MRITIKGFKYHEPKADKLSQLEDIEEERGVELATLSKVFESGYYCKCDEYRCCEDSDINFVKPDLVRIGYTSYVGYDSTAGETVSEFTLCLFEQDYDDECYVVRVKDYGKTWFLDKTELTKEN